MKNRPQTIKDVIAFGLCVGPLKDAPKRTERLFADLVEQRINEALQQAQGHKATVKTLKKLKSKLLQGE